MKKVPWLGIAYMSISLGLVSCVDSKYDLDKDIDWTISAGGEHLAIPVGSTDTAFLSKIIDVEEDGMLAVNGNHEYHLTKQDDIAVEPTSVKMVKIDKIDSDLEKVVVVGQGIVIPDDAAAKTTDVRAKVSSSGEFTTTVKDIDPALIELGSLIAETPSELVVTFNFQPEDRLTYNEVRPEKLELIFPEFLLFEEGQEGMQGNRLVLNSDVVLSSTSTGKDFSRTLKVKGYKFSDKAGDAGKRPENGMLTIASEVRAEGIVKTIGVEVNNGKLTLTPRAVLRSMTANRVVGIIQPEINVNDTEIELNDLPDFLKDEDTRLDLTNPVFQFKAENSLDTKVLVDAVLTPSRGGKELKENEVVIPELTLDKSSVTTIAVSRTGQSGLSGVRNVKQEDINNLFEIIPDFINVALKPRVENDEYYEVELGTDYDMPSSYDVNVPLSFEKNLNIVYKDSIDDLNKDLSDLDKVDFKVANLIFKAVNTIPLQMEMKPENVEIKDVYGKKIEGILVESDGKKITESKDGNEEVESEFALKLTSKEPGVLSRIERVCFKVTAVPGQATGVPLKDTQWLKMTKIKLNVPGGVKVDLN